MLVDYQFLEIRGEELLLLLGISLRAMNRVEGLNFSLGPSVLALSEKVETRLTGLLLQASIKAL